MHLRAVQAMSCRELVQYVTWCDEQESTAKTSRGDMEEKPGVPIASKYAALASAAMQHLEERDVLRLLADEGLDQVLCVNLKLSCKDSMMKYFMSIRYAKCCIANTVSHSCGKIWAGRLLR